MFSGRAGISPRSTRFTISVRAALAAAGRPIALPFSTMKPLS
jgi:hypothetical protein